LLVETVGPDNVLFASEMIGAVRGVNKRTGRFYDDTKSYVEAVPGITEADKRRIYESTARRVYPRLNAYLEGSPSPLS
ncbi:MAG: amidohydrolase family protein, partial [Chloroflexota bacterium]